MKDKLTIVLCSSSFSPKNTQRQDLKDGINVAELITCEICFCEHLANDMTKIACGHQFCNECWIQYLTIEIMQEGHSMMISCAAYDCDNLLYDEMIRKLITDQRVLEKYCQLITNSFIECNRLLNWCLTPKCGRVLRVEYIDCSKPIECQCNQLIW